MKGALQALQGKCDTCKFFDPSEHVEGEVQGLCRESSPQVSIITVQAQNPYTGQAQMVPQVVANFPSVAGSCWCGKHTRALSGLLNQ